MKEIKNKDDFIKILKRKIRALPQEERESAIDFYENYFNDAEDENKALANLEKPEEIAVKLLVEFGETKTKTKINIFLLILSAPLSIPLSITGVLCVFAWLLFLSCCILGLCCIAMFLAMFSGTTFISIIPAFIYNIPTGFLYLGLFLISIPSIYIFASLFKNIVRKICKRFKSRLIKIMKRGETYES